jgi:cadmium resistance protein CadD (predicted permease)
MKTTHLLYVAAGLVMVSVFFLTPPWTTVKVVLGVAPLVFLLMVVIAVCRARNLADESHDDDESGE